MVELRVLAIVGLLATAIVTSVTVVAVAALVEWLRGVGRRASERQARLGVSQRPEATGRLQC